MNKKFESLLPTKLIRNHLFPLFLFVLSFCCLFPHLSVSSCHHFEFWFSGLCSEQAEPVFKEPTRYSELADPLLRGNFPPKSLNQTVAVAAMCLRDDAYVRPLMTDVVTALSYLGQGPDAWTASPLSAPSSPFDDRLAENGNENNRDEVSARERQQAVAEAIEWGSNSRRDQMSALAATGSSEQ